MTSRRGRAAAAAAELTRHRRRHRHVELADAHDPGRVRHVDPAVLDVRDRYGFGAPRSDEYEVTGWRSDIVNLAQDFDGGTIYLNTDTSDAGFFRWGPPRAAADAVPARAEIERST